MKKKMIGGQYYTFYANEIKMHASEHFKRHPPYIQYSHSGRWQVLDVTLLGFLSWINVIAYIVFFLLCLSSLLCFLMCLSLSSRVLVPLLLCYFSFPSSVGIFFFDFPCCPPSMISIFFMLETASLTRVSQNNIFTSRTPKSFPPQVQEALWNG